MSWQPIQHEFVGGMAKAPQKISRSDRGYLRACEQPSRSRAILEIVAVNQHFWRWNLCDTPVELGGRFVRHLDKTEYAAREFHGRTRVLPGYEIRRVLHPILDSRLAREG